MLVSDYKVDASHAAFAKAVNLDPRMGEALSPLIEFHATSILIDTIRIVPTTLADDRRMAHLTRPVSVGVASTAGTPGVEFSASSAVSRVDISRPDGTLVRSIVGGATPSRWDLRTDAGAPVAGGLYRARVVGRGVSGRSIVTQVYVGLVRR